MREVYYFTPNINVAKRYAAWAKRRDTVVSVVIVQIAIQNSAIEAMGPPDLQRVFWPSLEWRELIWHCCRKEPFPRELSKYGKANVIIGTIANKLNRYYYRLLTP